MARVDPDRVDRVVKLLVDSDPTLTFDDAAELLRSYRLQLTVAEDAVNDPAWQAAVLTALNVGVRAVHGGVSVALASQEAPCLLPWGRGRDFAAVLEELGAKILAAPSALDHDVPTIAFGADAPMSHGSRPGAPWLRVQASQWRAGVTRYDAEQDLFSPSPIAAVLAGAMAVSECFQWLRGHAVAGDRDVRVSLWDPAGGADGPMVSELPAEFWLLGLGHLGQAYAWVLTMLPYPDDGARSLVLQDDDRLSPANRSTSMLHRDEAVGTRKTRLAAQILESLGWDTALIERRFRGGRLHAADDPRVMLGGVDNAAARRGYDESGFPVIIDAGLGAGPDGFLGVTVRRLPGRRSAAEIWGADRSPLRSLPRGAGYTALEAETGDQCGVELLAGRTVATAFVGVTAACWVIGGLIRELHGGAALALVDYSLRDPNCVVTITDSETAPLRMATVPCQRS